ncbi:spore germination protein [Neobacillus bataviensis LMG 21833]|uniref:Spore germination protein n=1 Tax=Neobacillus bataviensis LMG 21833 TaxID=1117379 RepID=K6DBL6_9BACI|nr:GerAB/ArcD/ProY family transporter [Neobacillus bataviensis]EKN65709.1 spore germination protein [Neobacillus bataviensis LMG 21833]
MEKAKIKASQMFMLVVLFEMGSAILIVPGFSAKQDAWVAILLGLAGGLVLFLVYYQLYKYYPDVPLTSYVQEITGKWIGRLLGLLYIIYFMYFATRVLRDFGELLTTTIYYNTPLIVINSLMMLTIIYGVHKGIEVIARVGELFFAVIYLMAMTGFVLILFSGIIDLGNLQPILEHGWKPVFIAFLGETILRPFGEMIAFTMLLPYLNDQKKVKAACMFGMILAGINVTITAVINVATVGVDLFLRSNFPLLTTIGKIQLANFIERLDVLFMLYLVIGGFFKISLFFYAAVVGATDLFRFKNHQKLSFPIGLIILLSSVTISSNYAEHIKEGIKVVPIYLQWPFQIIIPALLLIIAFFRNRKKKTISSLTSAGKRG